MTGATTRRRARLLGATTAVMVAASLSAFAPTAAADDHVLAPGEVASSSNMRLLTNVPKSGAFAGTGAFNSDLAFKDDYAFAGNYNGFTVYDIKQPRKAKEVVQVVCPGSQNDITVYGDLLFLSVDSTRTDDTCTSGPLTSLADAQAGRYWEGIRIWDISDPRQPEYIKSVATDCGSHTHTLVPDGDSLYVYVSSYSPNPNLANCQPPHDKISVVEVPLDEPTAASVVAEPVLFPGGGYAGPEVLTGQTQGCHDITAYPEIDRAAGACMGEGVVLDISDPVAPKVLETVTDTNFAFWHSATFSNDGGTVMFTDELGGGGAATCNPQVGPTRGANAYYTRSADDQLTFQSYFKLPREQASSENCVAHNGSLIPVRGDKDVMVQAWYQGGISVVDFTDPANPVELGWFDRGALGPERGAPLGNGVNLGGSWSAYYYDGYIYSNDIQLGLDVLEIRDGRTANGKSGKFPSDYNPQTQPRF